MSSLLKFTFNSDGKKINGYLKTPSRVFSDIKAKIDTSLFQEHQQPRCEIRFYWIDEDADEIDIVTQSDFEIFLEKFSERRHLLVAPKKAATNEEPASKSQNATAAAAAQPTSIPPADVSNDANSVHRNVECDSCLMAPIVGFRYKCIQCPDFDLCQHCEAKHVHADHMMVRMPNNSCPYVVDAWVSAGGCGRKSGRKHEKRCKNLDSGRIPQPYAFSFPAAAAAAAATGGEAEKSKESGGGRKHGRRHAARHSFLSHLYEMMHDLAEGGGAAAAAAATGDASTGNTSTSTTTTTTTSSGEDVNHEAVAKAAAEAAIAAAQNAHEVAVKTAEIAAKVAHETAVAAATAASENMTATTSAAAAAKVAQASNEKVDAPMTAPQQQQTPVGSMSGSPSLQDFVHLLDPKLLKGGMEILSNFNDMFAKMLDPMDGAEGGDSVPTSCPFATRRSSTMSQQSNNSKKSNDSMQSNKTNNSTPKPETKQQGNATKEGETKQQEVVNSLLDISDLGSDSESDSVSESFIKLNAPSKENTPEAAAAAAAATAPTTPQSSSSPAQSLNKSNVMDFAQLSADLKAHIAQEEKRNDSIASEAVEAAKAAVEMRAVPVFNTPPTTTENTTTAQQPKNPEDKRAVPIYHADQRINHSVHAMMSMGFSNEGAWLTQLLESVNGNIPEALDLISATQRNTR